MTVHPNTSRPRRHRALAQFRPLILEMLEERSLLTLTPQLLAELNSHQAGVEFDLSSNPRIAVADELVYFSGRSSSTAPYGLWKSDGTPAGTGLVKDVRPQSILTVSDVAYFITAGSKKALWRSDGTPEGTILLREFGSIFQLHNTTTDTSEAVNQTVYFVAQDKDDDAGLELWKTDGTPTGTIRVLDIAAGPASSLPRGLTSANGKLLFTANDAIHGRQLWTSDGTPQGTMPASNILLDAAFPPSLKDVNGTLFVAAHEGEFDTKLHKLDPATNELVFLADISRPGDARDFLTNLNGTLFFLVGEDLWRSDGTVPGTALVKSIKGITAISELGGALYFTLHTGSGFREIWKSDGTAVGTRPVTPPLSGATILTHHNGALHFIADSALWKTDGAASGTVRIKPLPTGFSQVNRVNGNLFFSATDGAEKLILWKSDLTESGPTTVVHLGVDKTANFISEKRPIAATAMLSGSIYLAASDGVHGEELWKTDGTPAGTVMVKDINPGMVSSSPSDFTVVNGTLFFTTDVGSPGVLWKTDGTSDGTVIFKEFPKTARLHGLVDVAGTLFFSVSHAQFSSFDPWHGLWKSDGTPEGTVRISNAVSRGDQRSLGGLLYFAGDAINHGNELWRSDGTPEGTYSLKDLYPGWIGSEPAGFTAVGQTVFFHTGFGTSLWMTDGTADGTVQIRSFEANYLTIFNNQLFFAGSNASGGSELWKSDGTIEGTVRVTDLVPGAAGSKPKFLINVNGKLFFAASQPTTGDELWASDGTPEGTILIKDINPGFAGSQPNTFAIVNGLLYFRANDGVHGEELWRSDGTAQGTFLVGDINPGRESSRPLYTNSVSNLPFAGPFVFPATDPVHGRELWTLVEINVAPSFVLGPNITVWDQAGPKKVTAWAKQLVAGPPDEAGQRFTFLVTVDKPHLFLQPPAIDALGNLKFTPKPGLSETARITVVLRDDGGTANGGMDQTAPQTFAIKITRNPWLHNRDRPRDVDGDNHISASDALSLINLLNAYGPSDEAEGELSEVMYYDVNDDGFASAGDALDVINHLNAFGPAEGEPATTPGSNDPSATDEVFAAASSADALSALFDLDAQSRAKRRR